MNSWGALGDLLSSQLPGKPLPAHIQSREKTFESTSEGRRCALRSNIPPSQWVDAETPWRVTTLGAAEGARWGEWAEPLLSGEALGTVSSGLWAPWRACCSSPWAPCCLLNHQAERERLERRQGPLSASREAVALCLGAPQRDRLSVEIFSRPWKVSIIFGIFVNTIAPVITRHETAPF